MGVEWESRIIDLTCKYIWYMVLFYLKVFILEKNVSRLCEPFVTFSYKSIYKEIETVCTKEF